MERFSTVWMPTVSGNFKVRVFFNFSDMFTHSCGEYYALCLAEDYMREIANVSINITVTAYREKEVLRVVRLSSHGVELVNIADRVGMDVGEVAKVMRQLLCKNYLRPHSRDRVGPNHPEARFYTSKDIRLLIDKLLLSKIS